MSVIEEKKTSSTAAGLSHGKAKTKITVLVMRVATLTELWRFKDYCS